MSNSIALTLAGLGLAIIAALAYRAIGLLRELRLQQQQSQQLNSEQQAAQRQSQKSIEVLARGALDQQVPLLEACIRIATLLDHLEIEEAERQRYGAVYQLSLKSSHIPRLEQWQALDTATRKEYRKQIEALETSHREPTHKALQQLVAIYSR